MQTWSKGHTYLHQPTAGPVPHARAQPLHAGSGSHRQLFRPYWGPPAWLSRWVKEQGKPASQKPLTAEESAKQSTKRQLHTTYVGAVGWEPHSSSTATCAGKVDHELPVHWSKGQTYINPRPGHYLTHVHSHIKRAVAAMDSCFALTGAYQHGIAVLSFKKFAVCRIQEFGSNYSGGYRVMGRGCKVVGREYQVVGRGCKVGCPPRSSVRFCGTILSSE